jgi:hypothetical protein
VLGKIDSAIENANKYVEKVVHSRRQAGRAVKNAEADERQKLQAELDQLAEKLSKPEYAEDAGTDSVAAASLTATPSSTSRLSRSPNRTQSSENDTVAATSHFESVATTM